MDNKWLRDRLVDTNITDSPAQEEIVIVDPIAEASKSVMIAYQNANKWLDIIKEELLMIHSTIFFSNYIHNLAHTMPVRFDKFGDILHTADMKVPYPATGYIPYELSDMPSIFTAIFSILESINISLRDFIKATQDGPHHSMSCAAEELLVDIDSERTNLYRMLRMYSSCENIITFDKEVCQYIDHLNNFLD